MWLCLSSANIYCVSVILGHCAGSCLVFKVILFGPWGTSTKQVRRYLNCFKKKQHHEILVNVILCTHPSYLLHNNWKVYLLYTLFRKDFMVKIIVDHSYKRLGKINHNTSQGEHLSNQRNIVNKLWTYKIAWCVLRTSV